MSVRHQLGHLDAQRLGEALDIQQRDVPLTPLHAADVVPVQPGQLSELLLRDASPLADLAQPTPEPDRYVAQDGAC